MANDAPARDLSQPEWVSAQSCDLLFPSPADDFAVKRHDLNELLITHPQATFFWQVSGHSMKDARDATATS